MWILALTVKYLARKQHLNMNVFQNKSTHTPETQEQQGIAGL